jgi:integrase/recombinase XerD
MPHEDWTWLRSVKTRLQATAPTHGRPRPVITSLALVDLGQELMDASKRRTGVSLRMIDAIRYRDGLMIALVGFHPLRRKNLAALEIGRHLVRQGDRWLLLLPRAEVKKKSRTAGSVPRLLSGCYPSANTAGLDKPGAMGQPRRGRSQLFRHMADFCAAYRCPTRYPHSPT